MLAKLDYHIDESDPDIVVLRRQDGSFVAALSAHGVTREGIVQAAREYYSRLREANTESFWTALTKILTAYRRNKRGRRTRPKTLPVGS